MIFLVLVAVLATNTELWTNPIVVGLVVGIPASAFGFLAYRRSERLDKAAALAAMVAEAGAGVERVIDGLDRIIDNLQEDRADLRQQLAECRAAYAELKRLH